MESRENNKNKLLLVPHLTPAIVHYYSWTITYP